MKKLITAIAILSTSIHMHGMEHLPPELQKICKEKGKESDYHCGKLVSMFECPHLLKHDRRSVAIAAICSHRVDKFDRAWSLSYHIHNLTENLPIENAVKIMDEAQKQYQNIGGYEKK